MTRKRERSIWRNGDKRRSTKIWAKADDTDENDTSGKLMKLPEKRILELILDTLQRRDVHEIFGEPVDPEEVEYYYEIIETPMDFGTIRAKLHEGMYHNLEQFEHDVFLIPKNAMYFNYSSSIYYKQARGINELAEELFHVLKTDPARLEREFPGETRRSVTRAMGKTKSVDLSKESTNQGETRKIESFEEDRRSAYESWQPSFDSITSSMGAKLYTESKQLDLMNHQETDYRKSLMSFVKDLGPTAQAIAKKKLQQLPHNPVSAKDQEGGSSSKKIQRHGVRTDRNDEENGRLENNMFLFKDLISSNKDNLCIGNKRTGIDPKEVKRSNVLDLNSVPEGKAHETRRSDDSVLQPIVLALECPRLDHSYDQMRSKDKKNATDQSSTVWQSNSQKSLSFYNSEARAVKPGDEGVKKNKPLELKLFADLSTSSFGFATPFLNQARLTNNRLNEHFHSGMNLGLGLGLHGFSRLRFQGAANTNRGWQEEASGSNPFQLYGGLNNQHPRPPRNPPGTDFPRFRFPTGNLF